jgi:hypothetical protein
MVNISSNSIKDMVVQAVAYAHSLAELARIAGLPRSTVVSWLRRGGGMTLKSAIRLKRALATLKRRNRRFAHLSEVSKS